MFGNWGSYETFKYPTGERISNVRYAQRARGAGAKQITAEWFKNPAGTMFLFPDTSLGPDCMALALTDAGEYVWIAIQVKNHNNTQNIIDGAVAGITPNFNGMSVVCFPVYVALIIVLEQNEVDNKKLVHHMRKLAHCEAEGDKERFRVLRVIASFPAKAVINRDISNAPVLPNGEKQHPLAVLNIEALLKNDPSKFLTATVKADLLCRVREASEEGEEKDDAEDEEEEEEEEEEEDSQDEYRPTPAGKKQLESLELRKSQRPRR